MNMIRKSLCASVAMLFVGSGVAFAQVTPTQPAPAPGMLECGKTYSATITIPAESFKAVGKMPKEGQAAAVRACEASVPPTAKSVVLSAYKCPDSCDLLVVTEGGPKTGGDCKASGCSVPPYGDHTADASEWIELCKVVLKNQTRAATPPMTDAEIEKTCKDFASQVGKPSDSPLSDSDANYGICTAKRTPIIIPGSSFICTSPPPAPGAVKPVHEGGAE